MKRTLAALGLAVVAGSTVLSAVSASEPPKTANAQVADFRQGGPDGPRGPMGWMRGEGPRAGREMHLAMQLSAAETLIGVRANQIDAWRDYTSALLALFEPPAPPKPDDAAKDGAKAFAREERLAREITERAAKAATLTKAIDVLKTTLTADQLEKLAGVELRFGPPRGPGMRGGPGMHGEPGMMGPDGHGPGGFHRGPAGGPPPAPGAGPDDAGPQGPGAPDDAAQPDDAPNPG
ncbi:hypothetical protein C3941_03735 [Kaistia algarum]|uniref:hypothetical protein n=1 Tax=Kaistia algarum TaxID=2083279 RepID=UPI000CE7812A|nr:hypothetical protein [Kaistia algarum]MCX5512676.1 hypothetical protein [Kaistia algarum]PPE81813.1 hypothetical protein C3941_03735 [Kaistia algarum]